MGTVTSLAEEFIESGEALSAEECYAFIRAEEHFQTPGGVLSEILRNICGAEGDEKQLAGILTARLASVGGVSGKTVGRWFSEGRIPSRSNGIKLCFALGLDLPQAKDLLRRCCRQPGFNVRDPEEAAELYCLSAGLSYADAQELLRRYREAPAPEAPELHGTRTIAAILSGTRWETPEAFLTTFLIPNKPSFEECFVTARREFDRLAMALRIKLLKNALRDEADTQGDPEGGEASTLTAVRAEALGLGMTCGEFDRLSSAQSWDRLIEWLLERDAASIPRIIPMDRLIRETLYGIPYRWGRSGGGDTDFSDFKSSGLGKDLLLCFPRADYLRDFRPGAGKEQKTRKALVTFFFLNYVCDWDPEVRDPRRKSYPDFHAALTEMLSRCGQGFLYPADPIECLILKSVAAFDRAAGRVGDPNAEEPAELFNEVLRVSFADGE